jgi:hypothetical protein
VPLADASVLAVADRVGREGEHLESSCTKQTPRHRSRTARIGRHRSCGLVVLRHFAGAWMPARSSQISLVGSRQKESMIHRPTLRSCLFLRGDLINRSSVDAMGQADYRGTSGAHIYCKIARQFKFGSDSARGRSYANLRCGLPVTIQTEHNARRTTDG